MKKYLGALAALGALLAASAAWSHHGSAPHFFMDRSVEFAGTVRLFEARNPHSFVNVEVTEGGETVLWRCELNSIASIRRAGIDENSFAVGSQVRLTGHPGRHDEHECYFRSATFADGRTVTQGQVPPAALPQARDGSRRAARHSWHLDARRRRRRGCGVAGHAAVSDTGRPCGERRLRPVP